MNVGDLVLANEFCYVCTSCGRELSTFIYVGGAGETDGYFSNFGFTTTCNHITLVSSNIEALRFCHVISAFESAIG